MGTGLNTTPNFGAKGAAEIAELTQIPFITVPNKFTCSDRRRD